MLCKAKVAQFEIARLVQEEVFGLEVAVENVVGVEVLEDKDDAVGRGEGGVM
jgi:hypothetical protein